MNDKNIAEFLKTRFRVDLNNEFNEFLKDILEKLKEPQEIEKERLLNSLKNDLIGTMELLRGFRIFKEV